MPPIILAVIVSIAFGFVVCWFTSKAERANIYQRGLQEGSQELAALKDRAQAREQKLADVTRERDQERQAVLALRAEVEVLKNEPGDLNQEQIEALKAAFEQKTAELLQAEQATNEGFRTHAAYQISDLEARLATADGARAKAEEETAQVQAAAQASAQSALALAGADQAGGTSLQGFSESEVEAKIAEAVEAVRSSASHALATQQDRIESLAAELAAAREELAETLARINAASSEPSDGSAAVAEAQAAQRAAQSAAESAEEENRQLQAQITELNARIGEAGEAETASQSELQQLRDAISLWRQRLEESEAQNQQIAAASDRRLDEVTQSLKQAVAAERDQALAARDVQFAETLAARERAHQEALELAVQNAAPPPAPESAAELTVLRESVTRLETGLIEISRSQGAQVAGLNQELAVLRQVAALSRAVCDSTLRHAAQAENLRIQFESAARGLLDGHASFANEVLTPARRLRASIENLAQAGAMPLAENSRSVETLQLAIEAAEPTVFSEEFTEA